MTTIGDADAGRVFDRSHAFFMGGIWEERDEITSLQATVHSLRDYFEEKEMKSKEKKSNVGFALQLVCAIFLLLACILTVCSLFTDFVVVPIDIAMMIMGSGSWLVNIAVAVIVYPIFVIIGRKKVWANVITLIMGIAFMIYVISSIVGGVI